MYRILHIVIFYFDVGFIFFPSNIKTFRNVFKLNCNVSDGRFDDVILCSMLFIIL